MLPRTSSIYVALPQLRQRPRSLVISITSLHPPIYSLPHLSTPSTHASHLYPLEKRGEGQSVFLATATPRHSRWEGSLRRLQHAAAPQMPDSEVSDSYGSSLPPPASLPTPFPPYIYGVCGEFGRNHLGWGFSSVLFPVKKEKNPIHGIFRTTKIVYLAQPKDKQVRSDILAIFFKTILALG